MNLDAADLVLVDGHVHLHSCFEPAAFLKAAQMNFDHVAQRFHPGQSFAGVLCLTEGARETGFDRLLDVGKRQNAAGPAGPNAWRLRHTKEDTSLVFSSTAARTLMVIAGRQLVSRERLEVLAIGTRQPFTEGAPVQDLIRQTAEADALPVIPWGFGKWTGARGKLVRQLLHTPGLPPFFLSDSGNRPAFWPPSSLFRLAQEKGIRNLPGSDPLPFSDEYRRPGSFGFVLPGPLSSTTPARNLKEKVSDPATPIPCFGNGETPWRFIRNQLGMQYQKRMTGE